MSPATGRDLWRAIAKIIGADELKKVRTATLTMPCDGAAVLTTEQCVVIQDGTTELAVKRFELSEII